MATTNNPPQVPKETMLSVSPLHIPEILNIVASYLESGDLTRCIRVSKSWRDIFLPHRWCVIQRVANPHPHIGPSNDTIYKHRHLVQDLTIFGSSTTFMHHPILRKLDIHANFGPRQTTHWDLTEKYPLLDDLTIRHATVDASFCRAISGHPSIRSLSLRSALIEEENLAFFWEACRHLESLLLTEANFKGGSMSVPKDAVFDQMRIVTISSIESVSPSEQLELVFHCPKLQKIAWFPPDAINVWVLINHPIQRDRWPQLDELHIPTEFQDAKLASILEGIRHCLGNVSNLRVWRGVLGPQTHKALALHFSTLVELNLGYNMSVASSTIRDVLCSCPKLEILRARTIYARDIAEGGPWVCQQLRELGVCIRVKETEQDLHPLVFERLSALTRLETLDVRESVYDDGSSDDVLDFRLDCGLGQLASFHELRILRFHTEITRTQQLGTKDVEWMIDNWMKLGGIYGHLNRDPGVEDQLKDALKSHGIDTW